MDSKAVYTINPIGFTGQEKKVLNTIFSLSQARESIFRQFTSDSKNKPDIVIVDFDDNKAVRQWQSLCIENIEYPSIPMIRITHKESDDTENYYTNRPLTVTKILSLLDHLAEQEFSSRKPIFTRELEATENQ